MRVFVSHQQRDASLAGRVAHRLNIIHGIDVYLDLIDPHAAQTGDELGEYLRRQLGLCNQLMAVVSQNTQTSWWVPWEIGIATEKDYPIATFAGDRMDLPEYLRKWPYLRSDADLDVYAVKSKEAASQFRLRKGYLSEGQARSQTTRDFHRGLRAALGQR